MKLDDAFTVANYAALRDRLVLQRGFARVVMRVNDETCDPAMIEAIRPAFVAEIDRRIAVLDGELEALGVELV